MTIQTLCENEWVSLKNIYDPENGVHGYVYSHETRCQGHIISVMPYRYDKDCNFEYLLREEVTPCWGMSPVVSTITGGWEGGNFEDDVVRELEEEAGYKITRNDLISLGTCRGTKSTDTIYHLYTVNLTDKAQEEYHGDGTELEAMAKSTWLSVLSTVQDPLAGMIFMRMII